MTDVNGINQTLANLGLGKPDDKKSKELGQDAFLELLVAQMNYQNPLEPQENGEFLSQMAQFGTVDGIQKIEESINSLSASLQSNQALQASSLVGRSVDVDSNVVNLSEGGEVKGNINVTSNTNDLKLSVYNQQGELVRQINMGTNNAGEVGFTWDGKTDSGATAPAGTYAIQATGIAGTEAKSFATTVSANVDSVTLASGGGQIQLNLAGIGTITLDQVKKIH